MRDIQRCPSQLSRLSRVFAVLALAASPATATDASDALAARTSESKRIEQLKPLHMETVIARGTTSRCAIVVPADEQWQRGGPAQSGPLTCLSGVDGSVLWKSHVAGDLVAAVPVDFEGDGEIELVAGYATLGVFVFDVTGRIQRRIGLDAVVRDVSVANLDRDGNLEITVACSDGQLIAMDSTGTIRATARLSVGLNRLAVVDVGGTPRIITCSTADVVAMEALSRQ